MLRAKRFTNASQFNAAGLTLVNPTKAHAISPISEGGETGSRGHVSVQVVCRPGQSRTPPRWLAGALKALSHCPRLEGSRPEPVQKNVGLGLTINFNLPEELQILKETIPWSSSRAKGHISRKMEMPGGIGLTKEGAPLVYGASFRAHKE